MRKSCIALFFLMVLVAALPSVGWAQDAKTLLRTALMATGSESVGVLQLSGFGSSYDGQLITLKSYTQQIDLAHRTSSIDVIRVQGAPFTEQGTNQNVSARSTWNTQVEFWITPYAFLKAGMTNTATLGMESVDGDVYRVVTVMLPGNHKLAGYINDQDRVERVRAWTDNNVMIEGVYRHYEDFRGLKVPTIQMRNRDGVCTQIVVVKDAEILAI